MRASSSLPEAPGRSLGLVAAGPLSSHPTCEMSSQDVILMPGRKRRLEKKKLCHFPSLSI
jgi:hypothetical protein